MMGSLKRAIIGDKPLALDGAALKCGDLVKVIDRRDDAVVMRGAIVSIEHDGDLDADVALVDGEYQAGAFGDPRNMPGRIKVPMSCVEPD